MNGAQAAFAFVGCICGLGGTGHPRLGPSAGARPAGRAATTPADATRVAAAYGLAPCANVLGSSATPLATHRALRRAERATPRAPAPGSVRHRTALSTSRTAGAPALLSHGGDCLTSRPPDVERGVSA
jgi:hypothetical protein